MFEFNLIFFGHLGAALTAKTTPASRHYKPYEVMVIMFANSRLFTDPAATEQCLHLFRILLLPIWQI